jgi:hypothetical protein
MDGITSLNLKYAIAILRHGAQVIAASNYFNINHYAALF